MFLPDIFTTFRKEKNDSVPPATPPAAAIETCRRITQENATTFYFGSQFLNPPQRAATWAVYAVCRLGDDIVDEPESGTREERCARLDAWWRAVEAAYRGAEPERAEDDLWRGLAWAVRTFDVPLYAFTELHQGFLMDLRGDPFTTMDDLSLYCHRVAGVVGLMIAPICGYDDDYEGENDGSPATLEQALLLGQAMQLTNILRDVGEDLHNGRLYLPADRMAHHGVCAETLHRGQVTDGYRALMRDLVDQARTWYRAAEPGIACLHQPGRLAIAVAARCYAGILDELERNGYDNLSQRAFVSSRRKLALIPPTLWKFRAR